MHFVCILICIHTNLNGHKENDNLGMQMFKNFEDITFFRSQNSSLVYAQLMN